jgi:hypothetical protein
VFEYNERKMRDQDITRIDLCNTVGRKMLKTDKRNKGKENEDERTRSIRYYEKHALIILAA